MPMASFFENGIFETFLILRVLLVVVRIAERACGCLFAAEQGMAYGIFLSNNMARSEVSFSLLFVWSG